MGQASSATQLHTIPPTGCVRENAGCLLIGIACRSFLLFHALLALWVTVFNLASLDQSSIRCRNICNRGDSGTGIPYNIAILVVTGFLQEGG